MRRRFFLLTLLSSLTPVDAIARAYGVNGWATRRNRRRGYAAPVSPPPPKAPTMEECRKVVPFYPDRLDCWVANEKGIPYQPKAKPP